MVFDIATWHTVRSPHMILRAVLSRAALFQIVCWCMVLWAEQAMPNTSGLPRECTICTYTRPQAYAKRAPFSGGGLTAVDLEGWHQCGLLDNQRARLLGLDVA